MSNWHRILWIDGKIRASAYPNCRTIAEQFEISVRQASRDIEYLRDSLGAPLAYSHERRGYRYTDGAFILPAMLLTDSQKKALSYLAFRYEKAGDPESRQLAELFVRMTDGCKGSIGQEADLTLAVMENETASAPEVHAVHAPELHKLDMLLQAVRQQAKVRLTYRSEGRSTRMERFLPIQVFPYQADNCVIGMDETVGQARLISLSSISDLAWQGERYEVSSFMGVTDLLAVLTEEPYSAVVSFAVPEYVCLLKHRFVPLDGRTFRMDFYDVNRFISALLGCPCEFRIVGPGWLRNMVRFRLKKMLKSLSP